MNILHSTLSTWRDRLAPISHTSTFRTTGQITPEEFVLAGDYLVYKFPTWSWADASSPAKRVSYLPERKQFLVTRGVPCHRRLDENFAGDAGKGEDVMVQDKLGSSRTSGDAGVGVNEDDGWLNTGGGMGGNGGGTAGTAGGNHESNIKDVRTVDESGNVGERETDEEDEEIPDMEDDDDDEAIIREPTSSSGKNAPVRTYTLYITYTPYYRTPRLYLSGYLSPSQPLPPLAMMEDIMGDYKDKTVTLEDFPLFDSGIKMASVHPCKHASVMKSLLDRADAALKIRQEKQLKRANAGGDSSTAKIEKGLEGLIDETEAKLKISPQGDANNKDKPGDSAGGDDWEVLQHDGSSEEDEDQRVAIRVDQYLVVFLKFIASVTPGIEHDFTMGV